MDAMRMTALLICTAAAVASVAGLTSEMMVGYAYAATKAAVVNLVRKAAAELAV